MQASGSFDVQLTPQEDAEFPAGRMLIDKTYAGGLEASGKGQMVSKQVEGGAAAYFAIEEVDGVLDGLRGAFTLLHRGYMDANGQSLEVTIMEGSGSGELEGINGTLRIIIDAAGHHYELDYAIQDS